jgi:hypothetical protein
MARHNGGQGKLITLPWLTLDLVRDHFAAMTARPLTALLPSELRLL